jgi:hypothetical protein
VDVISRSTDRTCHGAHAADNTADAGVQFLTPRLGNNPATAFRGKGDVVVKA